MTIDPRPVAERFAELTDRIAAVLDVVELKMRYLTTSGEPTPEDRARYTDLLHRLRGNGPELMFVVDLLADLAVSSDGVPPEAMLRHFRETAAEHLDQSEALIRRMGHDL